jgi:hypothetical protein
MRFLVMRIKARALEEQNLQSPSKIKTMLKSTTGQSSYFKEIKIAL